MYVRLVYGMRIAESNPQVLFCPDEKNDRLKERIREKLVEYLDRAETLKTFLNTQEENSKQSTSNSPTKNGATAGKTRKV